MKKGIFLFCIGLFSLNCYTNAKSYQIHILKEGETISELLYVNRYFPLYGEDGWVQKTLDMNHLASTHAKEIKKGFPIILPSRKTSNGGVSEQTAIREIQTISRNVQSKYFSISKHQDVLFQIIGGQTSVKMDNQNLVQNDNYELSLKVIGNNNFSSDRFTYNFWGQLSFQSQGNIVKDGSTIDFKPRYSISTGADLKTRHIPFSFGPEIKIEERSIAQKESNNFFTRRDQIGWIGFKVNKKINFKKNDLYIRAQYNSKIAQRSLDKIDNYDASQIILSADTHLTENYLIGLYSEQTTYDQNSVDQENLFGLNFSYKIK